MEKEPRSPAIPHPPSPVRGRRQRTAFAIALACVLSALLGAQGALARPANPKPLTRIQPDGTAVSIRALGDERVVFYEDEEGYTVLREADGWWRYADPASHKADRLRPTPLRVGLDRMPPAARKHVRPRIDPAKFHIEWDQKDDGTIGDLFRKWRAGNRKTGRSMGTLGVTEPLGVPLLVIPIEFSDWHHTNNAGDPAGEPGYNPNSTMPGNTAAAWNDLFGNPAVPGGLNHFYGEASYGSFQWEVAVASCDGALSHTNATCNGGWYRNPNTMAYWGADRSQGLNCYTDATRNIKDLIEWAIKAAEPEVGYAAYDTDNNGQISDAELMILVVHARDGQENYGYGCDGSDPANDHIWSHKWNIDTAVTVDGKTVPVGKTYSINPEFEPGLVWNAGANYYDVVDKWFGVGVYAHESFHTLGAPDLYDYDYDANVAGEWDLMDSGSYNGAKSGTHPSHMGAPLKQDIKLNADLPANSYGWIPDTSIVDVTAGIGTVDALAGSSPANVMHRLVMPADSTEWIVLENRAATGYYEPYLPEHGILAWHRDTGGTRDAWPYAANVLRKGWANTATGLNSPTAGAAFSLEDGETVLTATSDPSHDLNSGANSGLLDVRCVGAEGTRMQYVYGTISGPNPGFAGATVSGGADSDPWLDNGETATLTVNVDNSSCAGTAASSVVLEVTVAADSGVPAPAVTITPATVSLGDIAAGASANATFSVGLSCDPAGYAGKSLKLEFSITGANFADVTGSFFRDVDKDHAIFDDAEGGTTGWTSTQPFNPSITTCTPAAAGHGVWDWQVATDRAHSGTRAYHTPETSPTSNLAYTNPSEVWVSPAFTVPTGAKQLRFWSAANIPAAGYTRARVWVMADESGTWNRLNWYKDSGDSTWEEVVYDLSGFDAATQLKVLFTMYTYGCWPTGTASAEGWYVDDVAIVVDEQQTCTTECTTPPDAPAITSITDADACAQSGIQVHYTAGANATSHDLLRDGTVVVVGYVSGAIHNPGDGASHEYVVRAVKPGCDPADSPASSFADGNASPAAPAAPSVSDADACVQSGVTVTWGPVAGAESYDLLVDTTTIPNVTSPYAFDPGDTASHNYRVRAVTATCTGPYSITTAHADAATAPGAPAITSITDEDTCLASGIRVFFSAGTGAASHDLLRDGAVVVSGYASGALHVPGDTASHDYVVRAVAGTCATDSGAQAFADGIACVCTSAPTFAGLETVAPLEGTTCGLRLSWSAATSNCPNGPSVVYAVYRSTDPAFVPGPANLVASCVATTTWDDTLPAAGTNYYVVRAEDSTAFGTGPCNSGNLDANIVRGSGAVAEVTRTATYLADLLASGGSATATLSPAMDVLTPSAATLNYGLSWAASGTSEALTTPNFSGTSSSTTTRDLAPAATLAVSVTDAIFTFTSSSKKVTSATLQHVGTGASTNLGTPPSANAPYSVNVTAFYNSNGPGIYRFVVVSGNPAPTYSGISLVISKNIAGSLTANTQVELLDPSDTPCLVKAFGASDPAKPVNVAACYTGPGAYQVRVSENAGGAATLSNTTLEVTGLTCVPSTAPNPTVLTLRSTFGQNKLEWENPPDGPHGPAMIRFRTDGEFPGSPGDGAEVACAAGSPVYDPAGGTYNACLHTGLTNGTTYRYTLFLANADGAWSSGRRVAGTPFDHTSGPVKWAFSTSATAMTPPGIRPGAIGTGAVYAFSNDRVLHAASTTSSGGDWPRTGVFAWMPPVTNGPVQSRPPVVPITVGTASKVAYFGSHDGFVYAVNADTGATLWSHDAGAMVQAAVAGMFTRYGGVADLVFVATRDGAGPNRILFLDPYTGASRWPAFDNGGGAGTAIGIVSAGPSVAYGTNRLYFTSRASDTGSKGTVWCLNLDGTPTTAPTIRWARELSDVDSAAIVYSGRVYVGGNDGTIWVLDADTGDTKATLATNDGAVKGFIALLYTAMPRRLYFATNGKVWGLTHSTDGTNENLSEAFPPIDLPSPSIPVLRSGTSYLYVGSTLGRLFQIDVASPASSTSVTLGDGADQVGSPSIDTVNNLVLAGTEAGLLYAVQIPLP